MGQHRFAARLPDHSPTVRPERAPHLDIPHFHHEKWDGSGYPEGLGTQIPPAARLFATVDVWDALRSDRPYRPKRPNKKIIPYLLAETGTPFDPQIVKLFLEMLKSMI